MKVLCRTNIYVYESSRFETIKKRFCYKDVKLTPKCHLVYLEFEPEQLDIDWLAYVVNGRLEIIK